MIMVWEKMGNPMPVEEGNGIQTKQHGQLWGPATHRFEIHIMDPT